MGVIAVKGMMPPVDERDKLFLVPAAPPKRPCVGDDGAVDGALSGVAGSDIG